MPIAEIAKRLDWDRSFIYRQVRKHPQFPQRFAEAMAVRLREGETRTGHELEADLARALAASDGTRVAEIRQKLAADRSAADVVEAEQELERRTDDAARGVVGRRLADPGYYRGLLDRIGDPDYVASPGEQAELDWLARLPRTRRCVEVEEAWDSEVDRRIREDLADHARAQGDEVRAEEHLRREPNSYGTPFRPLTMRCADAVATLRFFGAEPTEETVAALRAQHRELNLRRLAPDDEPEPFEQVVPYWDAGAVAEPDGSRWRAPFVGEGAAARDPLAVAFALWRTAPAEQKASLNWAAVRSTALSSCQDPDSAADV